MTKFVNEHRFHNDDGKITFSLRTKWFLSMVIFVCLVCSVTNSNSDPTDTVLGDSQVRNNLPTQKSEDIKMELSIDKSQPITEQPVITSEQTTSQLKKKSVESPKIETKHCFSEYIKKQLIARNISEETAIESNDKYQYNFLNLDNRYDQSLTTTCNDETCTTGSWYDCDCEYTEIMSTVYDTYRTSKHVGWRVLGKFKDIIKDFTLETLDDFVISGFNDAEACLWKPEVGTFKMLKRDELVKKLRGKQITIIGDSEARNMFTSLVSWLEDDPMFNANFHVGGRFGHCETEGFLSLWFNKNCAWKVESKGPYPIYEGDGFVLKYITMAHGLKPNNPDKNPSTQRHGTNVYINGLVDMCQQIILSDKLEPHYILSQGLHINYNLNEIIQTVQLLDSNENFKNKTKATFISPPSLSFSTVLFGKNQHKVEKMNIKIKDWIKATKPEMRFIDYSKLSMKLVSMDGFHYGPNLNKVLMNIYASGL